MTDLPAGFAERVSERDGCLVWTGAKRNADGYGMVRRAGRALSTHRVVYEHAYGPIPSGMVVMHACDNPPCVNLEHLRLGTRADNNRDRQAKGRSATGDRHGFRVHPEAVTRGAANGKAKLTAAAVADIRSSTEPRRVLAERYGVSVGTVSRIRSGSYRAWQWLEAE